MDKKFRDILRSQQQIVIPSPPNESRKWDWSGDKCQAAYGNFSLMVDKRSEPVDWMTWARGPCCAVFKFQDKMMFLGEHEDVQHAIIACRRFAFLMRELTKEKDYGDLPL